MTRTSHQSHQSIWFNHPRLTPNSPSFIDHKVSNSPAPSITLYKSPHCSQSSPGKFSLKHNLFISVLYYNIATSIFQYLSRRLQYDVESPQSFVTPVQFRAHVARDWCQNDVGPPSDESWGGRIPYSPRPQPTAGIFLLLG